MSWGLYHYACHNINETYFTNSDLNQGLTYNMKGYSWYPVTLDEAATITGTFHFYNKEFVDCENTKGTNTGINNANKWSPLEADQHYMMQNGLFYDVTENLIIGDSVTLQGNIGAVDGNGTGALVYGTAYGWSKDNATHIVTIDSTNGKIILDGIKVWNFSYEIEEENSESHEMEIVTKTLDYAPLLINQASEYVTMNINDVSVSVDGTTHLSSYVNNGVTIDAATSLIGKAGNSDTSQYIRMYFTNIKLDGRDSENNSIYDTARYGTTKSIFTRATLLEQLRFTTGGAGTYNYYYNDDWGTGTPHKVTYGKEVGYKTEGQHPNQERMYAGEVAAGTSRFTNPDNRSSDPYAVFEDFLPYVKTVSTKAEIEGTDATKNYYQLQVNMQAAVKFDGCGTYNDPYQLKMLLMLPSCHVGSGAILRLMKRSIFLPAEQVQPGVLTKHSPIILLISLMVPPSLQLLEKQIFLMIICRNILQAHIIFSRQELLILRLTVLLRQIFRVLEQRTNGTQFRGVIIGIYNYY